MEILEGEEREKSQKKAHGYNSETTSFKGQGEEEERKETKENRELSLNFL